MVPQKTASELVFFPKIRGGNISLFPCFSDIKSERDQGKQEDSNKRHRRNSNQETGEDGVRQQMATDDNKK